MFHRLWTLIRKELQSLLREPQTRAILILPVLIQVILFPFAATLEVTNATIAIYNCIDSLEVRKKPGGHWIIRDLMGLDLVGLASL